MKSITAFAGAHPSFMNLARIIHEIHKRKAYYEMSKISATILTLRNNTNACEITFLNKTGLLSSHSKIIAPEILFAKEYKKCGISNSWMVM